jgi:hypothetical protein
MSTATVEAKENDSDPASAILDAALADNAILFTAVDNGAAGNLISVRLRSGYDFSLQVTGTDIVVLMDGTELASDIIAAVNADAVASLLVLAANSGTDDGSGPATVVDKTYLSGGMDIVIPGWVEAFELPSDFIKLRAVYDTQGNKIDKFDLRRVLGERCLVAGDYDSVVLDYVALVDEPTDFDPLFTAALTTLLASKLARAITGSESMESQLRQVYETVDLPAARCADAQDTQSGENHPLKEMLAGALTGPRGDFFPDLDDL